MSFGSGRATLNPSDFVWVDRKFPDGLPLPTRDTRAAAMELTYGYMMAERFAIIGGLAGPMVNVEDVPGRLVNLHLWVGVRRWLTRKAWIEGGLGPTWTSVAEGVGNEQIDSGAWGLGLLGGVGYDFVQFRRASEGYAHFVLQVQVRVSTHAAGGLRANSIAGLLGAGLGW
jgi:hypothetical protein